MKKAYLISVPKFNYRQLVFERPGNPVTEGFYEKISKKGGWFYDGEGNCIAIVDGFTMGDWVTVHHRDRILQTNSKLDI